MTDRMNLIDCNMQMKIVGIIMCRTNSLVIS